jgi:dUTP pyrophosphatase
MAATTLKFFKTHPDIIIPTFATKQSACFDVAFQNAGKHEYKGYSSINKAFTRPTPKGDIFVNAHERVMVPTGLILDIPEGYSVRLHARSGQSFKQGLILANSEAVIDSDYVDELFVLIYNRTETGVWIRNNDRIAQGELVQSLKYSLTETLEKPAQKTDRKGGLGSTGVNLGVTINVKS